MAKKEILSESKLTWRVERILRCKNVIPPGRFSVSMWTQRWLICAKPARAARMATSEVFAAVSGRTRFRYCWWTIFFSESCNRNEM